MGWISPLVLYVITEDEAPGKSCAFTVGSKTLSSSSKPLPYLGVLQWEMIHQSFCFTAFVHLPMLVFQGNVQYNLLIKTTDNIGKVVSKGRYLLNIGGLHHKLTVG